jgi:UDP-glucose 4-epimerase
VHVLVTGGTGYVGTVLVNSLRDAGHEVSVLTRNSPAEAGAVRGDLLAPADVHRAVRGVDAVCHLAAFTRVRDSLTAPLECFQTNVTGTLNLLEAMRRETERTGMPLRLVFASTGAIYGAPEHQPISEAQIPDPMGAYGASKLAAERAIGHQAATGAIGSAVLRAFNVAGAVGRHGDPDESRIIIVES